MHAAADTAPHRTPILHIHIPRVVLRLKHQPLPRSRLFLATLIDYSEALAWVSAGLSAVSAGRTHATRRDDHTHLPRASVASHEPVFPACRRTRAGCASH